MWISRVRHHFPDFAAEVIFYALPQTLNTHIFPDVLNNHRFFQMFFIRPGVDIIKKRTNVVSVPDVTYTAM